MTERQMRKLSTKEIRQYALENINNVEFLISKEAKIATKILKSRTFLGRIKGVFV